MIASFPLPDVPVITNSFPFRGVSAKESLAHFQVISTAPRWRLVHAKL